MIVPDEYLVMGGNCNIAGIDAHKPWLDVGVLG